MWALLVGGAAAAYFLFIRKSDAASTPDLSVMPGGGVAQWAMEQQAAEMAAIQAAQAAATQAAVEGYGRYR